MLFTKIHSNERQPPNLKLYYSLSLFSQSLQKELSNKFPEYHLFMKSSRHSDHSDSSGGSSPTQLRGDSPPKTVKFVDENTIERQHRRKQIEQDNILETIISEDELEVTETRRDGKRKRPHGSASEAVIIIIGICYNNDWHNH